MIRTFGSTLSARFRVPCVLGPLVLGLGVSVQHANAQQATPVFTPGNLVVLVEGCGVYQGSCTSVPNGTGTGVGNSSNGGYGDNQGSPITLFQFKPTGATSATYVNSLVLPQTGSGANLPIAGEYGSSSEGGLQLSGQGQYLTLGAYGVNAAVFDANPTTYGAAPSLALAQSGSLTGQSYTPVARTVVLVDAYGNVNSSTGVFNIFNTNNPRSVYSADGTSAYLSGQGSSGDATGGVFFTPLGGVNNAPTAITGLDTSAGTVSQDGRFVTVYNNTLYLSVDTKGGSNNARSFVGTLGTPPATSLFSSGAGPTQLVTQNNAASPTALTSTGKIIITASEANTVNAGSIGSKVTFNTSPSGYFFANPSTLYVADTGNPKQNSATSLLGVGGLQKWTNSKADGSGTWTLLYTMSTGLNLVANPSATPANTSGTTGLYGLAGMVSGSNVYLYATNATIADLDPTYLYGISDPLTATTNANTPFTLLATAPSDSNFKGVSFAPSLPAGSATINTVPQGLQVTTAGTGCAAGTYSTPVTLVWTPGASCTLTTTTPQTSGTTPYVFSQWQDGTTSRTDAVIAPTTSATYTATFTNTYQPVGVLEKAVDSKTSNANVAVGDSLTVSGWTADPVDGSPLANVKVYVDGASIGTPTLGVSRPDVAAAYSNPAYTNSGYQLTAATTGLALGPHAATVIAIDSAARSTTFGPNSFNIVATPIITAASSAIVFGTSSTTLTALIAYTGSVAPTGAVTFTVNGSATGVGAVSCTGSASPITCTASYVSSGLTLGTYNIVVTEAATNTYLSATGFGALTITTAPDFTFASTGTTSQTITRGSSASFTFNLAPLFASYPGAVSFTVTGLPSSATSTFTPATSSSTGGAQTVTLAIQTSATADNRLPARPSSGRSLWGSTGLAFAGVLMLPVFFRRRLRTGLSRNVSLLLAVCAGLGLTAALTGCSGSSAPPANYSVTVTAISGAVQHSSVVQLTVK